MSDESPWASPGEPYDPPLPAYAHPIPPPPPQPSPYAPQPFAAPASPQSPYQAGPPPAWATPPAIPPYGAKTGLDPWRVRGWRGGGAVVTRIFAVLSLVAAVIAVCAAGVWVGERAHARYERRYYVTAHGVVQWPDGEDPSFEGFADGYGAVRLSLADHTADEDVWDGREINVLVAPYDESDFLLPNDRSIPGHALAAFVVFTIGSLGWGLTALLLYRRRRVALDVVRHVAVPVPPGEPPRAEPVVTARATGAVVRLALAAVLVATVVPALVYTAHDAHTTTKTFTSTGTVVGYEDDAGTQTLGVNYYDERTQSQRKRPLTAAERGQPRHVGDALTVTYPEDDPEVGHGHLVLLLAWVVLALVAAVVLVRRALLWPARLRTAQRAAPHPVEVTAWTRVVLRRPWLLVVGPGMKRPVAVPLRNDREIPAALTGTVYLQGAVKPGHPVVLRAPNGALLAPAGPARRALWAELAFVGTSPPASPAPVAYGYVTSW